MKKVMLMAAILFVQPVVASHSTRAIRATEVGTAETAKVAEVAEVAKVAKVARVAPTAEVAGVAPVAEVAAVAPTKDCLAAKDLLPAAIGVLLGFMWIGVMIFRKPLNKL